MTLPNPYDSRILVDPIYEVGTGMDGSPGVKLGSLYLPGGSVNPLSQFGEVLAIGPKQEEIQVGWHVAYHPMNGSPCTWDGNDYMFVKDDDCCALVSMEDGEVFPRREWVMVLPEWSPREELRNGIYRINRWFDKPDPPSVGTIVRRGEKVEDPKLSLGRKILIPPFGGWEMGVKSTVYYMVKAKEIEAYIV